MPVWKAALALSLAPMLASAAPPEKKKTCEPPPIVVFKPGLAPNSTYQSNTEPPKRFAVPPKGFIKIAFGQDAIDQYCGVPPCGFVFRGCVRGDILVLPDPFKTSDEEFARIVRHELGHWAGWPATHGS